MQARDASYKIVYNFFNTKTHLKNIYNDQLLLIDYNNEDRKFIKELTTGCIRYFHELNFYINKFSYKKNKINNKILSILLIGMYQIKYMNSIPNYAAISTTVNLSKKYSKGSDKYINAILRKFVEKVDKIIIPVHYKHSFPEWLYNLFLNEYPLGDINNLMIELNSKPKNWLRIDKNYDIVIKLLNDKKIKYKHFKENNKYVSVDTIANKSIYEMIKNGDVYVQSPSSGLIVDLLNPSNNDHILDACSAPGGKFIDIISRVGSKNVTGLEINNYRYLKMDEKINSLNITNENLINIDFLKYYSRSFNKILLDVPCSSIGTISKSPDIKIIRKQKDFSNYKSLQLKILIHASKLLNSKGVIIYSTCSISRLENWDIINKFLSLNNDFKIVNAKKYISEKFTDKDGAIKILPDKHKIDGMFAVRMEKK